MTLEERKLPRKLFLGFGLTFCLFAVSLASGYANLLHQEETDRLNVQTYRLLSARAAMEASLPSLLAAARGHLLTGREDHARAVDQAAQRYAAAREEYRALAVDWPVLLRGLERLDRGARALAEGGRLAVALRARADAGLATREDLAGLAAWGAGEQFLAEAMDALSALAQAERQELAGRAEAQARARERARAVLLGVGLLAVALGAGLAVALARSILRPGRATVRFLALVEPGGEADQGPPRREEETRAAAPGPRQG